MFTHPFPKCSAVLANIIRVTLSIDDKVYDIANFTCDVFW